MAESGMTTERERFEAAMAEWAEEHGYWFEWLNGRYPSIAGAWAGWLARAALAQPAQPPAKVLAAMKDVLRISDRKHDAWDIVREYLKETTWDTTHSTTNSQTGDSAAPQPAPVAERSTDGGAGRATVAEVPREPTEAMIDAAIGIDLIKTGWRSGVAELWRQMYDAVRKGEG